MAACPVNLETKNGLKIMKRNTLFSGFFGSLRTFAVLLGLVFTITYTGVAVGNAAEVTAPPQTATVATVQADFVDGPAIYKSAFEALRDLHSELQDPAVRAEFVKQWEHRHDSDGVLKTEAGTDKAVYEMMWSLGQRFDYYKLPAAAKEEQDMTTARMAGIGATLNQKGLVKAIRALGKEPKREDVLPLLNLSDDRPMVVAEQPDTNSPAGKGGVMKGDRIVAVDGVPVNGKTLDAVVGTIRGTPGTTVKLSIIRSSDVADVKVEIALVRADFIVHVVKSTDLGSGVTLIKLDHFMSKYGAQEMFDALTTAAKGKAIILDLRGNPGGELGQVINMVAMFLDKGVIVQMLERDEDLKVTLTHSVTPNGYEGRIQISDGRDITKTGKRVPRVVPTNMPVVVLIDGGSASASEILSGALQVNGRALIIGQPTVGKGVGQTVVTIPGARNMHVTNFEFRPGSKVMDWVGIVPDIEVVQPEDANPLEDPTSDVQLNRAKLEAIAAIMGTPAPSRSDAEIAARKAELKKVNEDNFAKEVEARRKAIAAKPSADAASSPVDQDDK